MTSENTTMFTVLCNPFIIEHAQILIYILQFKVENFLCFLPKVNYVHALMTRGLKFTNYITNANCIKSNPSINHIRANKYMYKIQSSGLNYFITKLRLLRQNQLPSYVGQFSASNCDS